MLAQPLAGPSRLAFRSLPFTLDLACPISLPSKARSEPSWPVSSNDNPTAVIRTRYIEAVFLPEVLSPLSHLAEDILRLHGGPADVSQSLELLILPLGEIEKRHRKSIGPLVAACLTVGASSDVREARISEARKGSGLSSEDAELAMAAVALRSGCRKVEEATEAINSRFLIEEYERREVLVQIILLMVYTINAPKGKKRKRKSDQSPLFEPKEALELLFDRLSVWQAMAELQVGMDEKGKGKETGVSELLQRFWRDVMLSLFLDKLPDMIKGFHLKVFGKPYRDVEAPTTTKKPRKPKLTRARPSSDQIPILPPAPPARALSRAPSEVSHRSLHREESMSMHRSVSHASEVERPRSRSQSTDINTLPPDRTLPAKRPLARAPSGKDLFKGREVGLMRRSASGVIRSESRRDKEKTSLEGLGKRTGLLGRKTSDTKRLPDEVPVTDSETLVLATPSKPKLANQIFGPRPGGRYHPTPIAEEAEPPSGERRSWVAGTPGGASRISDTPASSRVAETPFARAVKGGDRWASRVGGLREEVQREVLERGEDEDELGGLMVMTDDEGGSGDEGDHGLIPETPAR